MGRVAELEPGDGFVADEVLRAALGAAQVTSETGRRHARGIRGCEFAAEGLGVAVLIGVGVDAGDGVADDVAGDGAVWGLSLIHI